MCLWDAETLDTDRNIVSNISSWLEINISLDIPKYGQGVISLSSRFDSVSLSSARRGWRKVEECDTIEIKIEMVYLIV